MKPRTPGDVVSEHVGSAEHVGSPLRVHLAKIQPPGLPTDTLERARLLEWLSLRTQARVVLVVADAGYGKTTLLADFTRRSRTRTLWYRLESGDRDWVTLVSHILAAGRMVDPGFGVGTANVLAEPSGSRTFEAAASALIEDLGRFADAPTALIFDDFHLVDDAVDARNLARELVALAPPLVTLIFAGRRRPSIPLAKLRAEGAVAELGMDDLRFDIPETARLLTDERGRELETDVVRALTSRTEGWIASLQLVKTAIRDRSRAEVRQFVGNLSGANQELYDYLAEVVVGDLPDDLQQFLMTTSVLQVVTPSFARLVSGLTSDQVTTLLADAERFALLSRVAGGPRTHLRYHPLVREFLEARFASVHGSEALRGLHAQVAGASTDWQVAAHHYRQAGDLSAVLDTVDSALPTIMANGQYTLAESFLESHPTGERRVGRHLVLGRVDLQLGDYAAAAANAKSVLDARASNHVQRDHALLNLLAVHFNFGHGEKALEVASQLGATSRDARLREIAVATKSILLANTAKDLDDVNRRLRAMARNQRRDQLHHFGVSMYNLAANSLMQDRISDAEREVEQALDAFAGTSAVVESQAAGVLLITIHLRDGRVDLAEQEMRSLLNSHAVLQDDALLEAADAFDAFGGQRLAHELLDKVGDPSTQTLSEQRINAVVRARISLRHGSPDGAYKALRGYPEGISTVVGLNAWRRVIAAQIALAEDHPDAPEMLRAAAQECGEAGIHSARRVAKLLYASTTSTKELSRAIVASAQVSPWTISYVAETVAPVLHQLDSSARSSVFAVGATHPERWRAELRRVVAMGGPSLLEAGALLEEIGERADVPLLRQAAKGAASKQAADLGRALARRVAERVFVEDQGRVVILAGRRVVAGSKIRRKVLTLLCYLLTRPSASATRDQVLEALWPDLDPDVAANSLNQTLYFLRRVFEEPYEEDLSPGYVHHHGDVIWLDRELVSSRSIECQQLVARFGPHPTPEQVERLCATYRGRFALDFEYEEWASGYRDSLHATYLEIVERALVQDVESGHHARAISNVRQALTADPDCDYLEAALLRLYKATGAHSAAAEQYQHYAAVIRNDLGMEPPPLDSL